MRRLPVTAALFLLGAAGIASATVNVVIVEGLGGEDRYTQQFAEQIESLQSAARTLTSEDRIRVVPAAADSRAAVLAHFDVLAANLQSDDQLIVYLVGHGSFDDHEYKFNIPGPDITEADIAQALDKVPTSNQVLVNTSSASGAGVEKWQHEDRVLVLATRSGVERHATKFGSHFAAALSDPSADINKNGIISAREAFDFAARGVADFFSENGRLATEHPRLEGERADRFSLARLVEEKPQQDDARLSELLAERDAIAARVDELRLNSDDMPVEQYQQRLLEGMLELATAEEAVEQREAELIRGQ